MSGKKYKKYSKDFKLSVVKEYLEGKISCYKLGIKYGIDPKCIRSWIQGYQSFGEEKFSPPKCNLNYSAEFKKVVVDTYLQGGITYQNVAKKFGIYAPTTIMAWVKQYNNHEELTDSRPKGVFNMVKGNVRKTTLEERIQIVECCIQHQKNYGRAKFNVSYGQVYSWVKKYEKDGPDGLLDRRGQTKEPDIMSEVERLRVELRMLQAKNKQQQMEIDFLKKVEEIEKR